LLFSLEPRRKKSHTPTSSKSLIYSVTNLPLNLYLSGPNLPGILNLIIPLADDDETIFSSVQRLFNHTEMAGKPERLRKIWEPTYTIVYENAVGADVGSEEQQGE
jgi:E3 ubiquitin-protein ligase HECTD1